MRQDGASFLLFVVSVQCEVLLTLSKHSNPEPQAQLEHTFDEHEGITSGNHLEVLSSLNTI